ncbi:MAG: hypothetical protein QM718_13185 [Steroidobacteraceae bacterium]
MATAARADDLVRVTSSFELKHAGAVVRQVAKLFSGGLGKGGAEKLTKELNAMPSDLPRTWDYQVQYHGATYPLQVRALLDDLGMLDLDFATAPAVAPAVRGAVDGYLNSRGL